MTFNGTNVPGVKSISTVNSTGSERHWQRPRPYGPKPKWQVPQLCGLGDPGPGPTGARASHYDPARDGGLNCEHRQRQLACFLDCKLKDLPVNADSDGPEASWHVRRRAAVGKTTSGPGGQHTRPSQKEMPFALHFAREQASIGARPRPERMSPCRPCLHHARCGAFSWFSGLYPAFGRAGVL